MKLQCSHYLPLDAKSQDGKLPVVIYCHCNSGSRRDAEEALYHLLPCGVGVVAFDFTVSTWGDTGGMELSAWVGLTVTVGLVFAWGVTVRNCWD